LDKDRLQQGTIILNIALIAMETPQRNVMERGVGMDSREPINLKRKSFASEKRKN